ncbi:MAG TPA: leucine--tRNA ligase, partial [Candidatus Bathyarchaeia archaeon]|nr:leucine--tRNA ligase [Candidatus Bathyarchaeia archaeon]
MTAAYPYPNSPQHIGHGRTYTIADANARFHRMRGYNTLYPMGFHYTGTPLYAMAKRLSQGDQEIIETFTDVYKIPESDLGELKEPRKMAEYFRNEIKKGMIEIGFSIDWRREFTTTDKLYNRFIQWHFRWLKDHGYITRGTHPVAWCPNDKNPVGVVDIQGDIEPELGEMHLIKFQDDGVVYPTATLRPETIFGVTNIWVSPQASYVQAEVDGEEWVVSRTAVDILEHQNHQVKIEREFPGKELLWKFVQNPMNQSKIPILPADFVEPDTGTGVVMSVPGHAPYDYQALIDLKASAAGSIEPEMAIVRKTEPISIISLEGFSGVPAADIVEKFGVSGQKDSRLDAATKELYSKEFHNGVMNDKAKPYSGMSVQSARTAIVNDLTRDGKMSVLYELVNRPLTCRCGARLVVHVVNNQWFINYGDESWKKKAHQCLDQMAILPEERRGEFNYTIDWLRERACARKVGLGTRLPWDDEWVVEALSDSVIYMSYYTLSKYISREWTSFKKFEKEPDQLTDSFFNYVFLGEGDPEAVAKETGVSKRIIESIRKEFQYFYPVDIRHSGKDLVSNHLSFYIFNHTALFQEERWPKGIVANGFVLMNGEKMSKSLENIVPLRQAIVKFGADPLRLGTISTAELNQDTDFSESLATNLQDRLVNLIQQSRKLKRRNITKKKYSTLDKWMLSRLSLAAQAATIAMEKLRVRQVVNIVLYHLDNDTAWYQRRLGPRRKTGDSRDQVLREVFDFKARMLAPLAPHVAEEMWEGLGNKGLVAEAEWPKADERQIDNAAEVSESIIKQTLEDTGEILRTTGLTAKRITFYLAPAWKWQVYAKALKASVEGKKRGDFIREVMGSPELREIGKQAADYATKSI